LVKSQGCIPVYLILEYDRKGIWGKNMKKVKRKEEEKKKKEKKREKKMEINLINNTFFPLPLSGSPI
jgi:hypothetical protein